MRIIWSKIFRGKNILFYNLGFRYPKIISLPLTAQCNYRCRFCEIRGVDEALKAKGALYQANYISLEYIKKLKAFIKRAVVVDFGGLTATGEPLLAPAFKEIVAYVRKINPGAVISITTNASLLTPELSDFLIKIKPLSLTFSLHALSSEVYQNIMGPNPGKVLDQIKYFCSKTSDRKGISTTINFGIGKHNYADAEKIIRFASDNNISFVNTYPYYKSPNNFEEDYSLYDNPELANKILSDIYVLASKLGQKMQPEKPLFIGKEIEEGKTNYKNCTQAEEYFILKADPFRTNSVGLGFCNRIVPFLIDLNKPLKKKDLLWAWRHPILKKLRKRELEICTFCHDKETPFLRSLNYEGYKNKRDEAVKQSLSKFQGEKLSPNRSIELQEDNIFSL